MTEPESHIIQESESAIITAQLVEEGRVKLTAYFKVPSEFKASITLPPRAAAELGRWLENNDYI